jgi:hypothetical protein
VAWNLGLVYMGRPHICSCSNYKNLTGGIAPVACLVLQNCTGGVNVHMFWTLHKYLNMVCKQTLHSCFALCEHSQSVNTHFPLQANITKDLL